MKVKGFQKVKPDALKFNNGCETVEFDSLQTNGYHFQVLVTCMNSNPPQMEVTLNFPQLRLCS